MKYKKENGVVLVQFIKSPIGHDENIGRLNLKKDERAQIAGKIKSGVPLDVILDEIRDHASDIHAALTTKTKQDLLNIIRDFNLDPTRSHSDDAVSIDL
ncbi:unnamed protein product [Macrosiphum euphorbiae]|uniref:Uncharacterized protein n=1 Tax=Macrosiphum euphorbiae TaxID=13131 RepID=A0AAV0WT08_9HEMI|nr:unnamed protein product [Macrosiphum euphorbiae]